MEGLLKNGEIPSEHIPQIIFEMPCLASIDLTDTKINCLPEICDAQFHEVVLANNFFHAFPAMIFHLNKLVLLDLSENQIKKIPNEVGTLKSLKVLHLTKNSIDSLPDAVGDMSALEECYLGRNQIQQLSEAMGNLKNLKTLVLEQNRITSLPESLGNLENLETLDLTANDLHSLPRDLYKMTGLTTMHSYLKLQKCGLWLHLNPLESVPQHIWKTDKPTGLFSYLRNQPGENLRHPQRVKMTIIGNCMSGKTSLIRALKNSASPAAGASVRPTELVEFSLWRTTNDLNVFVHDFSGRATGVPLQSVCSLFLPSNCLCLLTYDASTYKTDQYEHCIGDWVDLILSSCRSVVLKVIATKQGLCSPTDANRVEQEKYKIHQMIGVHLKNYKKRLRKTAKNIDKILEELVHETEAPVTRKLEAERARLELMLQTDAICLQPDVLMVGSAVDVGNLNAEIEQTFLDEKLFPRNISGTGFISRKKLLAFDKMTKAQSGWMLGGSEVLEIATRCDIEDNDVLNVLQHLRDSGNLLWFPMIPPLRDQVFHRPSRLTEIFGSVIRTDMTTYLDFDKSRVFSMFGFSAESLNAAKLKITQNGEFSRTLLSAMWFPQTIKTEHIIQRCEILQKFNICYSVPESSENEDEISNSLIFPALKTESYNVASIDVIKLKWRETLSNQQWHTVTYNFPVLKAVGLFERLSCRIQDMVVERMDWKNFVIGRLKEGLLTLKQVNDSISVTVEGARTDLECLEILDRIGQAVDSLMLLYPGVVYCCESSRSVH